MSDEDHHRSKDENPTPITTKRSTPILSKYATTSQLPATEKKKFPSTLTGDFDKNLTIEKAKFESSGSTTPLPQPPTSSISTPAIGAIVSLPPQPSSMPPIPPILLDKDALPPIRTKSPPLTTSVTLPIVTTLQSLNNQQHQGGGTGTGHSTPTTIASISTMPSQSTPLLAKSKAKVEDRRSIKRKKLPPMSGTATPSEVFHRNLVDAVSNVEDSDENEQYVYPYSGNNTDTTYHGGTNSATTTIDHSNPPLHRTTSSLYRPQSTRSFITSNEHQQQQQQQQQPKRGASTGFIGEFLRPILFKSKSDANTAAIRTTSSTSGDESYRPKLRNYVMDHPFNSSQGKLNQQPEWLESPPSLHGGGRRKNMYSSNYVIPDNGYTTDDEEAQHLLAAPPTRRSLQQQQRINKASRSSCSRFIKNVFISLLGLFILFFLLVTYLAKPLKDLNVEMGRVLSSDKELIFDLHINAINSNFWTVHVAEADISVFAFSQVVPSSTNLVDARGVDPAEYLGGFYHFDEPLSFSSSFYDNEAVTAISQIRIKSPGADKAGNERWSRMIRYPYGLVVRGVLKYKPLYYSPYPQSVAICDVVRVNPTTGKVSEDPDQGFCLTYGDGGGDNHTIATTLS